MVQDTISHNSLGCAGDFPALQKNVVPAGNFGGQPHILQSLCHGLHKRSHVQAEIRIIVGDKGVVQVSQVVIDGTAAGAAAYNADVVSINVGPVDLRLQYLIIANYHGLVVLP